MDISITSSRGFVTYIFIYKTNNLAITALISVNEGTVILVFLLILENGLRLHSLNSLTEICPTKEITYL